MMMDLHRGLNVFYYQDSASILGLSGEEEVAFSLSLYKILWDAGYWGEIGGKKNYS
jgi:hypothetical protein